MLLYRDLAERYFELERSHSELQSDLSGLMPLFRENSCARILDAGCGSGEHAAELIRRGFQVTGVDRSAHMIRAAKRRFPEYIESFHVSDWDHFRGPQPHSFDAVLCLFGSLGYRLKNARVERTLSAFRRNLRTAGLLVLELWHAAPLASAARVLARPSAAAQSPGLTQRSQGRPPRFEPRFADRNGGQSGDLKRTRDWQVISERPFVVRLDYRYTTDAGLRRDRHFLRAFLPDELRWLAAGAGFVLESVSDSFARGGTSIGPDRIRMVAVLRAV